MSHRPSSSQRHSSENLTTRLLHRRGPATELSDTTEDHHMSSKVPIRRRSRRVSRRLDARVAEHARVLVQCLPGRRGPARKTVQQIMLTPRHLSRPRTVTVSATSAQGSFPLRKKKKVRVLRPGREPNVSAVRQHNEKKRSTADFDEGVTTSSRNFIASSSSTHFTSVVQTPQQRLTASFRRHNTFPRRRLTTGKPRPGSSAGRDQNEIDLRSWDSLMCETSIAIRRLGRCGYEDAQSSCTVHRPAHISASPIAEHSRCFRGSSPGGHPRILAAGKIAPPGRHTCRLGWMSGLDDMLGGGIHAGYSVLVSRTVEIEQERPPPPSSSAGMARGAVRRGVAIG